MIYIKKIIYSILATSFTLVVLLTLVLFLYAAFFFKPLPVKKKAVEDKITKSEELPSPAIEKAEPTKKN